MIDWKNWRPNVDGALALLAEGGNSDNGTLTMETGVCKPWSVATIRALRRRGYQVDNLTTGVFLLHKKGENK